MTHLMHKNEMLYGCQNALFDYRFDFFGFNYSRCVLFTKSFCFTFFFFDGHYTCWYVFFGNKLMSLGGLIIFQLVGSENAYLSSPLIAEILFFISRIISISYSLYTITLKKNDMTPSRSSFPCSNLKKF